MDSLGDRMKNAYENVTRLYLTKRTPVIIRCDARAFHSFTKNEWVERPFDKNIMDAMVYAAQYVAEDMQGFKAAYIQSDEMSFLMTDYDQLETQGWFDYNLNKIVSISASIATANFNYRYQYLVEKTNCVADCDYIPHAYFDSRAFNIPREDVANYYLWRAKDWERNSLQMYARSLYSHSQLENKDREDMHEMLYAKGKNWAKDLSDREKNGTFLIRTNEGIVQRSDIQSNYNDIATIIDPLIYPDQKVVAAIGYGLTDVQQKMLRAMRDSLELHPGEINANGE